MKKLLLASLLLTATYAKAIDQVMVDRLNNDLDYVASIFSNYYAPREWKESSFGWDIQKELAIAKTKVQAANSVLDVRAAVAGLIKSTKDYHVSYTFYSTERAVLPLSVKTVEGKTLIVWINRDLLPAGVFPFVEGDEIVGMGGVPVAEVLKEIKNHLGTNVEVTDAALADLYLTRRTARLNMMVPQGPISIQVLRQGQTQSSTHQLFWEYAEEQIPGQLSYLSDEVVWTQPSAITLPKPIMVAPAAKAVRDIGATNPYSIGERNSYLPDFGARLWSSPAFYPFDAYIYENEAGKKIGMIRIPDYTPQIPAMATAVFGEVMKKFEAETEGLLIDQLNNPGGSVFYLYSLVSILAKESMSTPAHRIAVRPGDVKECITTLGQLESITNDAEAKKLIGPSIEGYPTSYQLVLGIRYFCKFMMAEYKAGKKMTDPYFIWGVDRINPHPTIHYSKPIVIMTNQLDFSGGDFFPAIMQDNKRATIVGTRTAGAGGYVLAAEFPNSFGIESISFTGSIAQRPSLDPIENLGVTPDVEIPVTVEDVRGGYTNYINQVKAVINGKL